jgi:hypothetical protein
LEFKLFDVTGTWIIYTPTCHICGMEPETNHHAVINCTKAKALRQRLRETWSLPDEENLQPTGNDWVLVLRNQVDSEMRSKLLLLWCRAWHLRNNIIFGYGKCSIEQSAIFVQSYLSSFTNNSLLKDVV